MLFFIIILAHECYAVKAPLRIYGGIDAKSEEYPFVVRIEAQSSNNYTNGTIVTDHQHFCTASALSPVWLISAAHCLLQTYPITQTRPLDIDVGKMIIRYGHVENSPWTKDSFSDVLYTIKHPRYAMWSTDIGIRYSRNDIGLLKTSPIKVRSYIKISAVDYKTVYGHEAVMCGFGIMAKKEADGTLVTNDTLSLMKPLQLLKVSFVKCKYDVTSAPALCLTSKCGERTSGCPGDSGGPVMHPSGLLAVIGSGYTGCLGKIKRPDIAGVVIAVSPYIEWIYSYVNA